MWIQKKGCLQLRLHSSETHRFFIVTCHNYMKDVWLSLASRLSLTSCDTMNTLTWSCGHPRTSLLSASANTVVSVKSNKPAALLVVTTPGNSTFSVYVHIMCSSPSCMCNCLYSEPTVWQHAAAEMQRLRIVNLPDLLFCLAAKWEATNLKQVEEAYDTVNMEIR